MNLATFSELPSNFCGLATSTCVLGYVNVATPSASPNPAYTIIAYSVASYFYYCWTTCFKLMLCQLIVYSSGGIVDNDGGGDSNVGGSVSDGDWLSESADSVLNLLPNSYSDSDIFLYKS